MFLYLPTPLLFTPFCRVVRRGHVHALLMPNIVYVHAIHCHLVDGTAHPLPSRPSRFYPPNHQPSCPSPERITETWQSRASNTPLAHPSTHSVLRGSGTHLQPKTSQAAMRDPQTQILTSGSEVQIPSTYPFSTLIPPPRSKSVVFAVAWTTTVGGVSSVSFAVFRGEKR